ncbi:hypothetical protein ISS07_05480, partial [Candidatus Woesearchaeota archaeon]|nr:hypothetical protein [Candidatus Woesearchaeota archaeon]
MKLETIIEGLQDVIKEAKSFADKPEVRRGAEYLVPIFGIFPFYNDVFKEKIAATAD